MVSLSWGFIQRIDLFARDLPTFNIGGQKRAGNVIGGILSMAILYLTFIFALTKLLHLAERRNPQVNTYLRKEAMSDEKY